MGLTASFSPLGDTSEKLTLVTPDASFAPAHELMVRKERVQHIPSTDILRSNYLGFANTQNLLDPANHDKLALAMIAAVNVRSIIYTHLAAIPERGGAIRFTDMPKDTNEICNRPTKRIGDAQLNVALLYAVSNIGDQATDPGARGSGRRLIESVYGELLDLPIIPTTVSPTFSFPQWLYHNGYEPGQLNDGDMVSLHLARIATGQDNVGGFHLSNGALVGDCDVVRCEPNHKEAVDGRRVMTNYIYTAPTSLNAFKAARASEMNVTAMAKHLLEKLPDNLDATIFPVADEIFPRAAGKGFYIDRVKLMQLYDPQTSRRDDTSPGMLEELNPSLSR